MRRMTLLLLLMLLPVFPALAQENTPEPTPALDFRPEEFMSFPQQLFLRVTLPIATAEIDRLALNIAPERRTSVTINFPQDATFEFVGDYTVANYTWEINAGNMPPLFGAINYTWRLTTKSGQVYDLSRRVEYNDTRTTWTTIEGDGYEVTLPAFSPGSKMALSTGQINPLAAILKRNTGQTTSIKWLAFPSDLPPGCNLDANKKPVVLVYNTVQARADIPCDVDLANQVYAQSGYTVVQLAADELLQNRLLRAIVPAYYAPLWAAHPDVPAWFRRGIEQLYLPPGSQALVSQRQSLRSGRALTIAEMSTEPAADPGSAWQYQSYGMVLYIMDNIGVDKVFALARGEEDKTFAESFQAATGLSLDSLVSDWQTWLFTTRAPGAYLYNVFAPSTPTPTMTFTPTKTRTPMPPTPTSTITPDYSPTPRPTRTRIPPTPTITPLPAQSFNLRPTAIPPTPVPTMEQVIPGLPINKGQLVVIGAVVVLVLILVIFGLLWRRR